MAIPNNRLVPILIHFTFMFLHNSFNPSIKKIGLNKNSSKECGFKKIIYSLMILINRRVVPINIKIKPRILVIIFLILSLGIEKSSHYLFILLNTNYFSNLLHTFIYLVSFLFINHLQELFFIQNTNAKFFSFLQF